MNGCGGGGGLQKNRDLHCSCSHTQERNGTIASLQTSEDGGYSRGRARAVCEKENAFFHPHGIWGGQKQKLIGRLGRGERDVYTYNV